MGILGIGQGGGNIADKAYDRGFVTGAINFRKDLETLSRVKNKYAIPVGFGAGKDRSVGINAVQNHHEGMIDFIKNTFLGKVDILYVAFTGGGGTGSGIAPILIDIALDVLECPIGAIVILPDKSEDPTAQANSSKAVTELTNIEGLATTFMIDNDVAKSSFPDFNKKALYDYTNTYIVENLARVNELTGKNSDIANFDPEDLLNLLTTSGYAIIANGFVEPRQDLAEKFSKESIAEDIMTSWENTIYPNMTYSRATKAGMVFEVPVGITDKIDYDLIFSETGKPLTLFNGIYSSLENHVTTILTGMEYPYNRLEEIDNILEQNKELIQNSMGRQRGYQSKLNWYDDSSLKARRVKDDVPQDEAGKKTSIIDKMKKYGK